MTRDRTQFPNRYWTFVGREGELALNEGNLAPSQYRDIFSESLVGNTRFVVQRKKQLASFTMAREQMDDARRPAVARIWYRNPPSAAAPPDLRPPCVLSVFLLIGHNPNAVGLYVETERSEGIGFAEIEPRSYLTAANVQGQSLSGEMFASQPGAEIPCVRNHMDSVCGHQKLEKGVRYEM